MLNCCLNLNSLFLASLNIQKWNYINSIKLSRLSKPVSHSCQILIEQKTFSWVSSLTNQSDHQWSPRAQSTPAPELVVWTRNVILVVFQVCDKNPWCWTFQNSKSSEPVYHLNLWSRLKDNLGLVSTRTIWANLWTEIPLIIKLLLYDKANPWKSNIECYIFSIALMLQTKYHLSLWGSLASHSKCWSEQTHSESQCHTCTGTVKCHQVLDPPSLEEFRHELQRISWDKNKSKIMVSCLTIVFCQWTVFYFNKTK